MRVLRALSIMVMDILIIVTLYFTNLWERAE